MSPPTKMCIGADFDDRPVITIDTTFFLAENTIRADERARVLGAIATWINAQKGNVDTRESMRRTEIAREALRMLRLASKRALQ